MSAGFTAGPWEFDGAGRINAVQFHVPSPYPLVNKDGTEEVYMRGIVALPYSCGDETYEGNARLIASAPELLEALQNLINAHAIPSSICKERPAYEAARSAIAKATGGTT